MLVISKQFESNYNKLRAIIQAYLNTNKTWIVKTSERQFQWTWITWARAKAKAKARAKARAKAKAAATARARAKERARIATKVRAKARATAKAKAVENLTMTKNAVCAEKKESFRTRQLVMSKP